MLLGLHKKWPAHPDWLGRYDFSTTRPLRRKRYASLGPLSVPLPSLGFSDLKLVSTSYIEYEVRAHRSRVREWDRLFFRGFVWSDPILYVDKGGVGDGEGEEVVPSSAESTPSPPRMPGSWSYVDVKAPSAPSPPDVHDTHAPTPQSDSLPPPRKRKEHYTSRADLLEAFEILLKMEEQLHYAVLDLDGAAHHWSRAVCCVSKHNDGGEGGVFISPEFVRRDLRSKHHEMVKRHAEAAAEVRVQWERVATAAEYFSNFLGFLADHEASRRFPDHWDEYTPASGDEYARAVPLWFSSVWAFQLAHVLSGCVDVGHFWISVWHYRPVCEDPCEDMNRALGEVYELVEEMLVDAAVPRRLWGQWHRSYTPLLGKRRRRTDKATIRALRQAASNGHDYLSLGGALQTLKLRLHKVRPDRTGFAIAHSDFTFLLLLMDCYEQCTCACSRSSTDTASTEQDTYVDHQPAIWQGTIERSARAWLPPLTESLLESPASARTESTFETDYECAHSEVSVPSPPSEASLPTPQSASSSEYESRSMELRWLADGGRIVVAGQAG